MKRSYLLLSALLVSAAIVYAIIAWTPRKSKDGIKFFEGSWQETLDKAKAEQKPILLDIYATWCGPCKMLKRETFTDKEVGSYFNANYICVSFDGENGDGVMLANKYRITGYPTLIILNKNGELVNKEIGFMPPDDLIAFGKQSYTK